MKIFVIIPAFNEETMVAKVISKIPRRLVGVGKVTTVVVDDGSTDLTSFEARRAGATVIRHSVNCGLGGALGTGFAYAKKNKADIVITMDADGQHNPSDILPMIKQINKKKVDVIIGSRMIAKQKMPLDRQIINFLGNIATYVLFGIWTSDSQSGMRAFTKKALDKIEIKTNRMEVSTEFFKEIKRNNLTFSEVAIKPIYTIYSRNKGQKNLNALDVFYKIFLSIAR